MSNTIESLEIEIIGSSQSAEQALDALEQSLTKIRNAVKGGCGLKGVANQLTEMNNSLGELNSANITRLENLTKALDALSRLGSFKLSSSVANQISKLGTATKTLDGVDFSKLGTLASSLTPLTTVGKTNLSPIISSLEKLPAVNQALSNMDWGGMNAGIGQLIDVVKPLNELGKSNLSSVLNPLTKLPDTFKTLESVDMSAFKSKIEELTSSLKPLADEMQKVATGFSAFPAKIQKLLNSTSQIPKANNIAAFSYTNLAAKIGLAYAGMRKAASVIGSWIDKSNQYIENMNLFNVSMGQYADEAFEYANTVENLMGIDPGEWARNQAVFMTLASGFGVASDRAYAMSQNLTQLGYDLSSFFNDTYEETMQKLQSGISGELEPLRRYGYDLSQAKLEAVALSLGIDKAVSSMTQAEKAELRYYAIMTQITEAQGDMARTLNDPANQIRVFRSQLNMAAREIGNLFLPALNAILPYAISVAKVIRYVAEAIGKLFGIESSSSGKSPTIEITNGAEDISDAYDSATDSIKEFKHAMLGIDELNVISPPDNSSSNGTDLGIGSGGFDFELPTYDFMKGLTESRVNKIVEEMKEWLGLTGEITSWADLFDTRLGKILLTVGTIGTAFALWKVSGIVTTALDGLSKLGGSGFFKTLSNAAWATSLGTHISGGLMKAFGGTSPAWIASVFGAKITTGLQSVGSMITAAGGGWAVAAVAAVIGTLTLAIVDYDFSEVGHKIGTKLGEICRTVVDWLAVIGMPIIDGLNAAIDWCVENVTFENIIKLFNPYTWSREIIPWMVEVGINIVGGILKGMWEGLINLLSNIGEFVVGVYTGFCEAFGIHSPADSMVPIGEFIIAGVLEGLTTGWDELLLWWKDLKLPQLHFKMPHFTWSTREATGYVKTVMDFLNIPARIPKLSVSWYAGGGFPSVGELFVAREAGPEMVGKMGSRTTVANNQQIVDGISEGVYAAVLAAMRQSESNGGQAVNVYLDGRQITAAVEKRQGERGMSMVNRRAYGYG